MPLIDKTCLAGMKSPVRHIMQEHLGNSIFTISPERSAEFAASLGDFRLIYNNERRWIFHADPIRKEISVSRGAIELVWCASLAHYLYYTKLFQGKKHDAEHEIDIHKVPEVSDAFKLLRWAIVCQLNNNSNDDWPEGLPLPVPCPEKESNENVADELTLVACAFLLHHELAHINLRHRGFTKSDLQDSSLRHLCLDQEKDADATAAEWVLGGITPSIPAFVKRILGITQALLILNMIGLYRGSLGGFSHPFSYDRLDSRLKGALGAQSHVAKGFAFSILDLHYQNTGRKMQQTKFDTPEEALEHLCDMLAKEFSKSPEASDQ